MFVFCCHAKWMPAGSNSGSLFVFSQVTHVCRARYETASSQKIEHQPTIQISFNCIQNAFYFYQYPFASVDEFENDTVLAKYLSMYSIFDSTLDPCTAEAGEVKWPQKN